MPQSFPLDPGRAFHSLQNCLPAMVYAVLLLCLCSGCAAKPYPYGANLETQYTLQLREEEPQFERGRPVPFLDKTGHYVISLPSKLLLFDWEVDNHSISPETEKIMACYLAANDLHQVKVRLNQYAPGGEWRRLVKNTDMPGFFRFTFGVLTTTLYTILPGRFFGGDNYNPFTNTINIYSNNPTIAMHEAGHAKDFADKNRHFRGWYALMRILPLMPLWQEGKATGDAIGYTIEEEMTEEQKESYKTLYPAYSTYIVGEGLRWIVLDPWITYPIQLAAALPAHVVGRIKAANVDDEKEPAPEIEPPQEEIAADGSSFSGQYQ